MLDLIAWEDHVSLDDFIRSNWTLDTDPIKLMARGDIILFLDGLSEMTGAAADKEQMLGAIGIGGVDDLLRGVVERAALDPLGQQRARAHPSLRPHRPGAARAGHRPPRLLVLPPARVAQEGRADGRRVPAQQPVHVPVDGEARGLLRDAPAGPEGPADDQPSTQSAILPLTTPLKSTPGESSPAVSQKTRNGKPFL